VKLVKTGLRGAGVMASAAIVQQALTVRDHRRFPVPGLLPDIEPPYVLAGHSIVGLPIRAFADLYPGLTAGLGLVDASHPDQWVRWPARDRERAKLADR
jgi:pimeloyl-ACP methyl ester carboxylesterase